MKNHHHHHHYQPHNKKQNREPPRWFRTPLAQTITLGLVFFFVFSSYTTIQFYARTVYGPQLAANSVSAVYATFTAACLLAPAVTNKWGSRAVLFWGVLGYAALVAASLVYFVYGDKFRSIVVAGGGILGIGAALLWTGQGRLILDYAAVAPTQAGTLMGVFWAVFQGSALVGGAISFWFYSESPSSGSAWLYVLFLVFILVGAMSTQLLLPPSMLLQPVATIQPTMPSPDAEQQQQQVAPTEVSALTAKRTESSALSLASVDTLPAELANPTTTTDSCHDESEQDDDSSLSWSQQAVATLALFGTKPMLTLSILFFYTGFNQPYQQATFSNRFFSKRTIGLEMIIFHLLEIVGAVYVGRALDGGGKNDTHQHEPLPLPPPRRGKRELAVQCLLLFIVVNTTGNLVAWYQEHSNDVVAVDITDAKSFLPSLALACWGFADSQIQVYVYWLLGTLYETGDDHARAVGFYKCIQSLGVSVGFSLTPLSRCNAMQQLAWSSAIYVVGTSLAFLQLPS